MLDSTFVEAIQQVSVDAVQPTAIHELCDQGRVALYLPKEGLKFFPKEMPPRKHIVTSLESFAKVVDQFGEQGVPVWVSMDRIVSLLEVESTGLRDNTLTMDLTAHPAFKLLNSNQWLNQKSMVDLIRHDLSDCLVGPPTALDSLKSLKFSVQAETTGKVTASTAAMGKSVTAQVTGEVDLPETVSFEFHPFPMLSEELDVNVVIFCTLFSDPEEQKLRLSPKPGSIDEAKRKALNALIKHLEETVPSSPVFAGRP